MTRTHVPVLAGELIDADGPGAGRDRGGLHVRRRRSRAPGRRPARARPARSCASTATRPPRSASRSSRARSPARRASCAWTTPTASSCCARRGSQADIVYLDLGISSMQVDARERGFSYSYDAPLDMRMDPTPGARRARGRERLGRAPAGQLFRRYGEEPNARRDRARDRAAPRARADRDHRRARGGRSRPPCRPPCGAASAAAIRPSASSRRSASP